VASSLAQGLAIGAGFAVFNDLAGAIKNVVTSAAGWQETMAQVANNTNMSNQAMGQMNDTILAMGQKTSAPLDQLATAYMHIANMGFQGADATDVLNAAMQSAVSTGGNTADVANVLANVMHEFAMKGFQ
jgi:TP901 family phage tail tape measure protein